MNKQVFCSKKANQPILPPTMFPKSGHDKLPTEHRPCSDSCNSAFTCSYTPAPYCHGQRIQDHPFQTRQGQTERRAGILHVADQWVMACPILDCGASGATTITFLSFCISSNSILIPGAVIPSSLTTKIIGFLFAILRMQEKF